MGKQRKPPTVADHRRRLFWRWQLSVCLLRQIRKELAKARMNTKWIATTNTTSNQSFDQDRQAHRVVQEIASKVYVGAVASQCRDPTALIGVPNVVCNFVCRLQFVVAAIASEAKNVDNSPVSICRHFDAWHKFQRAFHCALPCSAMACRCVVVRQREHFHACIRNAVHKQRRIETAIAAVAVKVEVSEQMRRR